MAWPSADDSKAECYIQNQVDTKVVPYEQLKPYRGDTVPRWAIEFRDKLLKTGPDAAGGPECPRKVYH